MGTISLRVSEAERDMLNEASKVYGCGVSSMIKQIVFDKLEDEYDLSLVREYEELKAKGGVKTFSHEEAWKMIGEDDV